MSARLRIYLTGTVCLEYGGMVVDERQLPARQGRLVLAYLIGERSRPVTRDELGDAIWSDTLPTAWESALSALVSMLRHLLQSLGLPATVASISGRSGRYQMQLPSDTWVDIEAAAQALDEAEGSLRNRAEVRRVYERCRTLLREKVGLDPSPELEALRQTLLQRPSSVNQGC